mgnify:FL=1
MSFRQVREYVPPYSVSSDVVIRRLPEVVFCTWEMITPALPFCTASRGKSALSDKTVPSAACRQ